MNFGRKWVKQWTIWILCVCVCVCVLTNMCTHRTFCFQYCLKKLVNIDMKKYSSTPLSPCSTKPPKQWLQNRSKQQNSSYPKALIVQTLLQTRSIGQPQLMSIKFTSVVSHKSWAQRVIVSGKPPHICFMKNVIIQMFMIYLHANHFKQ